ncbi:hypothetical protein FB451DRAFT_1372458 [Mycena latifolia]|nr:hypothetical protein FB451DRAFT_1372458 [Mycena latifolia]
MKLGSALDQRDDIEADQNSEGISRVGNSQVSLTGCERGWDQGRQDGIKNQINFTVMRAEDIPGCQCGWKELMSGRVNCFVVRVDWVRVQLSADEINQVLVNETKLMNGQQNESPEGSAGQPASMRNSEHGRWKSKRNSIKSSQINSEWDWRCARADLVRRRTAPRISAWKGGWMRREGGSVGEPEKRLKNLYIQQRNWENRRSKRNKCGKDRTLTH